MTYTHLFAPPKPEDFDYEPDPMGRLGMGRQVERRDPDDDPGWDLARADWMQDAPLTKIVGETPFGLFGSVGRDKQNRRGDVFKLQALLHREGHLDAEATGGPTGYWGNRDDDALRAFQKENGLNVDGYVDPDGETIGKLRGFYAPQKPAIHRTLEKGPDDPPAFLQTMEKKYDPHEDNRLTLLNRSHDPAMQQAAPAQFAQAQEVATDAAPDRGDAPPAPQPKSPISGWRVDEAGLKIIRDAERQGKTWLHPKMNPEDKLERSDPQHCVPLVQAVVPGIGMADSWKEGAKINGMNDPPLEPGTAIATFRDGRYPNKDTGNHAAIFLRYGVDKNGNEGIFVLDQYQDKAAGERHIRFQGAGLPSNRAGAFSIIQRGRK